MRQHKLLLIGVILAFAAMVTLLFVSGHKETRSHAAINDLVIVDMPVETIAVSLQSSYQKQRKVYGLVEASQQIMTAFERSGLLASMSVSEGDFVRRGQLLASLDTARLVAQQTELSAAQQNAQAQLKLANLSLQRVQELVRNKLAPEQQLDEAETRLDASEAMLDEILARQASLKVELEKSQLYAPFSGQVTRQLLDLGSVVDAGSPVFELTTVQELEARIGLPMNTARLFELKQAVILQKDKLNITAHLLTISQQRQQQTRTMDATFILDSDAAKQGVAVGDVVSLSLPQEMQQSGTWLPLSALAEGSRGLWSVYVLQAEEPYFRVERRMLSLHQAEATRAFVSGAIKDGDLIVATGVHRLTPGQIVKTTRPFKPAKDI